jgi:PAS domain S-box-containing protein
VTFVVDGRGRLSSVGTAFAASLGTDPDALAGDPLASLVVDDDRQAVRDALDAVRSGECERRRCSCRLRGHGDTVVEGDLELVANPALVFGVFTASEPTAAAAVSATPDAPKSAAAESIAPTASEPTQRATDRTVASVESERERFGRLFELIRDPVVEVEVVDGEPVVRSVNSRFVDVFGYESDRIVGESLNEFIVPDDCGGEATEFDRRTAGGRANRAVVTRRTAWGRREFLYHGIPFETDTDGRRGFAIYSDITAEKQSREHLQVLHRVLRHNLRNELNVVLGRADEIREAAADPSVDRAAAQIADHAEQLLAASEKARSAADVVEYESRRESTDVAAHLRAVADASRQAAPDATIETDLPSRLPVSGTATVREAAANLVENALEHTGPSTTVRISAVEDGRDAVVTVTDDGPGIPPAEWEAIFGDGHLTQLDHSSGLGLWLVKWVVESAGGRVDYERADGWTSVVLTLPRATGRPSAEEPAT